MAPAAAAVGSVPETNTTELGARLRPAPQRAPVGRRKRDARYSVVTRSDLWWAAGGSGCARTLPRYCDPPSPPSTLHVRRVMAEPAPAPASAGLPRPKALDSYSLQRFRPGFRESFPSREWRPARAAIAGVLSVFLPASSVSAEVLPPVSGGTLPSCL